MANNKTIVLCAMGIFLLSASCSSNDYKKDFSAITSELSSPDYYGRSNYNNGDIKASKYIIDYISEIDGITPAGDLPCTPTPAFPPHKSQVRPGNEGRWSEISDNEKYLPFLQHFQIPMNVMRGDMEMTVDNISLRATVGFVAKEFSPSCHGTFPVEYVPDSLVTQFNFIKHLNSGKFEGKFAVVNMEQYQNLPCHPFERYKPYLGELDSTKIAGVILKDKELVPYFKARSYFQTEIPVFAVNESFPKDASNITIALDAEFLHSHDAHNIIAYLPGTNPKKPHITFIAHYDHLGLMGRENIFYGANDNASGAAMLCVLAKYFGKNRPECGLQFIWLDAEEENLLGAFYYCQNPTMPVDNIKLVINLDMVGDDSDHLATECSQNGMAELEIIKEINSNNGGYPPFNIALQELLDNSDHYAFSEAGIPVIYFSTEGSYLKEYHSPRDSNSNFSTENFDRLFNLLVTYVNK